MKVDTHPQLYSISYSISKCISNLSVGGRPSSRIRCVRRLRKGLYEIQAPGSTNFAPTGSYWYLADCVINLAWFKSPECKNICGKRANQHDPICSLKPRTATRNIQDAVEVTSNLEWYRVLDVEKVYILDVITTTCRTKCQWPSVHHQTLTREVTMPGLRNGTSYVNSKNQQG
jgi:hypothetical protein